MNPWKYKPWWCQPWSILLTGAILIGSSWALTRTVWLSAIVSIPVLIWMGYFLLIWPRLMEQSAILDVHQQPNQDSTPSS